MPSRRLRSSESASAPRTLVAVVLYFLDILALRARIVLGRVAIDRFCGVSEHRLSSSRLRYGPNRHQERVRRQRASWTVRSCEGGRSADRLGTFRRVRICKPELRTSRGADLVSVRARSRLCSLPFSDCSVSHRDSVSSLSLPRGGLSPHSLAADPLRVSRIALTPCRELIRSTGNRR